MSDCGVSLCTETQTSFLRETWLNIIIPCITYFDSGVNYGQTNSVMCTIKCVHK